MIYEDNSSGKVNGPRNQMEQEHKQFRLNFEKQLLRLLKKIVLMCSIEEDKKEEKGQKGVKKILLNELKFIDMKIQDDPKTSALIKQWKKTEKRISQPKSNKFHVGRSKKLTRDQILRELRLDRQDKEKILNYASQKGIQSVSTLKQLKEYIDEILNIKDAHDFSFHAFLGIIKILILSQVERNYLIQIEKELVESQGLDEEIVSINGQINEEKQKKLQKSKQVYCDPNNEKKKAIGPKSVESLLAEISRLENQLEKANQKLNQTVAYNENLREKINQLRKEKNNIDKIYKDLYKEVEGKKREIQETIEQAGKHYEERNKAENDLKQLQKAAEEQKQTFENQMQALNENLKRDRKFKKFIKNKQKEREQLEQLEETIKQNEQIIKRKQELNQAIEDEYELSAEKEKQIKQAFDKLKEKVKVQEPQQLLDRFSDLYKKNEHMNTYVQSLTKELEEIEEQIKTIKKEIDYYNTQGATYDTEKRQKKIDLKQKILDEEKKKAILKSQYEKSIETLNLIKKYLINVMVSIGCEEKQIEELKNSAITEENITKFLGILEEKGIQVITEYARLIAEQIKLEKQDKLEKSTTDPQITTQIYTQIEDLRNIIAYENANIMSSFSNWDREKDKNQKYEFLEEMLQEVDEKQEQNTTESKANDEEDIQEQARKFLHQRLNQDRQNLNPSGNSGGKLKLKKKQK